jgi:hypothetical protein
MTTTPKNQMPDPVIPSGPKAKKPRTRKVPKQKAKKYKVPPQPKDVDAILQALVSLPDVGDDIWDALEVEPSTVGGAKPVGKRVKRETRKTGPAQPPTVGDLARDFAYAQMMEDAAFDKPPPFRGV